MYQFLIIAYLFTLLSQHLCFYFVVLTYFRNIGEEYEKLTDMVQTAYDAIVNKGAAWAKDVIESEDPIASATDGQMTTVCTFSSLRLETCRSMYKCFKLYNYEARHFGTRVLW